MKAIETKLKGCFILEPTIYEDERGCFFEGYNENTFEELIGQKINFVQDNQSKSSYGVLRGLHFQKGEYAQAKLVRVISGEVLDVTVDLREGSTTYGQYESIILSGENKKQSFVPRGFAHGFVVLSESADFFYKCDNYYKKEAESGLIYNDSALNINWMLAPEDLIISLKDRALPTLLELQ